MIVKFKNVISKAFIATILCVTSFVGFSGSVSAEEIGNDYFLSKEDLLEKPLSVEPLSKEQLLEKGVESSKVDGLIEKMDKGEKLDSDIYLEKKPVLATNENPVVRKDFEDGSFIESKIEDITPTENLLTSKTSIGMSTNTVKQTGGLSTYRTLKVSQYTSWGYLSYVVEIYFPQGGYGKILRAYNWYDIGLVQNVNYKGIYRANETSSNDAVAIYKVRVRVKYTPITFLSKLEFRIRDGRYWSVY